jgi:hypothetical protein
VVARRFSFLSSGTFMRIGVVDGPTDAVEVTAWRVLKQLLDECAAPPRLFAPSAAAFRTAGERCSRMRFCPNRSAHRGALGRRRAARCSAISSPLLRCVAGFLAGRSRALPVRIAAFVGREDPIASEAAIRAWAARSSDRLSLMVVAGDHFHFA